MVSPRTTLSLLALCLALAVPAAAQPPSGAPDPPPPTDDRKVQVFGVTHVSSQDVMNVLSRTFRIAEISVVRRAVVVRALPKELEAIAMVIRSLDVAPSLASTTPTRSLILRVRVLTAEPSVAAQIDLAAGADACLQALSSAAGKGARLDLDVTMAPALDGSLRCESRGIEDDRQIDIKISLVAKPPESGMIAGNLEARYSRSKPIERESAGPQVAGFIQEASLFIDQPVNIATTASAILGGRCTSGAGIYIVLTPVRQ